MCVYLTPPIDTQVGLVWSTGRPVHHPLSHQHRDVPTHWAAEQHTGFFCSRATQAHNAAVIITFQTERQDYCCQEQSTGINSLCNTYKKFIYLTSYVLSTLNQVSFWVVLNRLFKLKHYYSLDVCMFSVLFLIPFFYNGSNSTECVLNEIELMQCMTCALGITAYSLSIHLTWTLFFFSWN